METSCVADTIADCAIGSGSGSGCASDNGCSAHVSASRSGDGAAAACSPGSDDVAAGGGGAPLLPHVCGRATAAARSGTGLLPAQPLARSGDLGAATAGLHGELGDLSFLLDPASQLPPFWGDWAAHVISTRHTPSSPSSSPPPLPPPPPQQQQQPYYSTAGAAAAGEVTNASGAVTDVGAAPGANAGCQQSWP